MRAQRLQDVIELALRGSLCKWHAQRFLEPYVDCDGRSTALQRGTGAPVDAERWGRTLSGGGVAVKHHQHTGTCTLATQQSRSAEHI